MKNCSTYAPLTFWSACLALILITAACSGNDPSARSEEDSTATQTFSIFMLRGPYQFNGASPWYAPLNLGTPGQSLKFALDSGSNTNWVTSSQCTTPACQQHTPFRIYDSSTFQFLDTAIDTMNFGPWGDMQVNLGEDLLSLPNTQLSIPTSIMLSVKYEGEKFVELDWDGGIGFPAQMHDTTTSWLLQQLVQQGSIDADQVYASFYMDTDNNEGIVTLGGYDLDLVDPDSRLSFPFSVYDLLPYLWTTVLNSWTVGGQEVIAPGQGFHFAFDTGSSDFKGDTSATDQAIDLINAYYQTYGQYPEMELSMGTDQYGNPGKLMLGPDQYRVMIQAGNGAGQMQTAIDTLNIPELLLVGSIMLEHLYTVFWYERTGTPGNYQLQPTETWLFNKTNGPKIIQNSSGS